MTVKTPDKLVGIGGGGSKVVYRLLEQDWLLDAVLEQEDNDSLTATTIDTAINDEAHNRADDIKETIKEKADNHGITGAHNDTLRLNQEQVVESLPRQWRENALVSDMEVRPLMEDQGLHAWWLEEGREPMKNKNRKGLGNGVDRRRSLSKAMYHVSEYENMGILPNIQANDQVCVVAALGGGTGSGMSTELAADLAAEGPEAVHLFAIIPHTSARGDEKANAHAALSELEYLQLNDESPFDSITLIPHSRLVNDEEFEQAAARIILAHQNIWHEGNLSNYLPPDENDANRPPKYGTFMLAAPHSVKFDIGLKDDAESEVKTLCDNRETFLQAEANLHEVIEQYIWDHFREVAEETLGDQATGEIELTSERGRDAAQRLRKRIERVEALLEEDVLSTAAGQDTIVEIRDCVSDVTDDITDEPLNISPAKSDIEQTQLFVERAPDSIIDRLGTLNYTETDDLSYQIYNTIREEFERIRDRVRIERAIQQLTSEQLETIDLNEDEARLLRKGLDAVLNPDTRDPGAADAALGTRGRIKDLRRELEIATERYEGFNGFYDHVADDLADRANSWRRNVSGDAEQLAAINDYRDDTVEAISELITVIEDRLRDLRQAYERGNANAVSVPGQDPLPYSDEKLEEIDNNLEAMGVEKIGRTALKKSFEDLEAICEATIEHNEGSSLNPFDKTVDRTKIFNESLGSLRQRWDDRDVFTIQPGRSDSDTRVQGPFSVEFYDDALRRAGDIDAQETELRENLSDAFKEAFTTDDGDESNLPSFSSEYWDGLDDRAPTVVVPEDTDLGLLRDRLDRIIKSSDKTDEAELMDAMVPLAPFQLQPSNLEEFEADAPDESSVSGQLFAAYLEPINDRISELQSELERLGANDVTDGIGLIDAFGTLLEIGGAAANADPDTYDLPRANDDGIHGIEAETYSADLHRIYTDPENQPLYSAQIEAEGASDEEHPYVTRLQTDPSELIGDPSHIGDTDVVKTRHDDIFGTLRQTISWLANNEYERAPLNDFDPQPGVSDRAAANYDGHRYYPVYYSRGLDRRVNVSEPIHSEIEEQLNQESVRTDDPNIFGNEQYDIGDRDEVTMVMFIGGVFLDNLSVLTENDGYYDVYTSERGNEGFAGMRHAVGMGGRWNRYESLRQQVLDGTDGTVEMEDFETDTEFGASVYRAEWQQITPEFMERLTYLKNSEDESAVDLFQEMYQVDCHETTCRRNLPETEPGE